MILETATHLKTVAKLHRISIPLIIIDFIKMST